MLKAERFDAQDRARLADEDKLSQEGIRTVSKRLYVRNNKRDEEQVVEIDSIRAEVLKERD